MQTTSFTVGKQKLKATIFSPLHKQEKNPAILFVHGWTSEKERSYQYAKSLAKLGFICFIFDMRGHGESEGERKAFTIRDFLDDVVAAYDYLVKLDGIDKNNISAIGTSFGSYLLTLLSTKRNLKNLSLRAPAEYANESLDQLKYKASGSNNPQIVHWRSKIKSFDETYSLQALHDFSGNIQIIESEKDTVVPHQTIQNYIHAVSDKSKLTHNVLKDAPHSIKEGVFRNEVEKVLVDWFKKISNG